MLSVSVAMATYNGEQHLRRQLASLAAQSYAPAELVVVDDGSDDETLSIITAFAKDSPFPVRVHRNETRLGYRGNFMRAANLCTSDLIAFCDQDDSWYPNKIAACVDQFSEPDILLVYHNADVVTVDGNRIGQLYKIAVGQSLASGSMSHSEGFTQVFRRSMLRFSNLWMISLDHLNTGEPLAHDQWFFFLAAALGKISYLDEPLVAYVQHGNNKFGWAGTVVSPRKMKSVLMNPSDECSEFSKYLERRSAILDSARADLNGVWKKRAQIATNNYRRLSEAYARRSTIYTSTKFVDRLKIFRELLANGGYGGDWCLSRKSLIKDIFLGVPIGPFLKSQRNAPDLRLRSFDQQSRKVSSTK
jgi:glycosyltransferase involved in cell wall biosynthesis